MEFTNKPFSGIEIRKVDAISGNPLAGAVFEIRKQNGEYVNEVTTDNGGKASIANAEPGWYVLTEIKAPQGYVIDEAAKTVEVKYGVPTVVTFSNKPLSGIEILKVNAVTNVVDPSSVAEDFNTEMQDDFANDNGLNYLTEFTTTTSMSALTLSPLELTPKELTNVIDKVRMAALDNSYYGEWTANYGENGEYINEITAQSGQFHSGASFRLELDWSTKLETLSTGDYFTIRIPEEFINTAYIVNPTNGLLYEDANDDNSPVVARYRVELFTDNVTFDSSVLITITFTDYVNNKDKIAGHFWLMCYALSFDGADENGETIKVEFEMNVDGSLNTFSFDVTVLPPPPSRTWEPSDYNYNKYGSCSPTYIIDGYYYFWWDMFINMDFNTETPIVDHYKIEDVIPPDSPHKFISPADKANLREQKNLHYIMIREYIGADGDVYDTPEKRYAKFKDDYNANGSENWIYKCFRWNGNAGYFLPDCEDKQILTGIDGGVGVNVTGYANPSSDAAYISVDRKTLNLDFGRVTRPTIISYYTIAEIELDERALGNADTISAIKNTVRFYGEDLDLGENSTQIHKYSFTAGGGGTGPTYDKEFCFTKTDKNGNALQGARFLLYGDANCTGVIYGIAVSDVSGRVKFTGLKAGTYFIKEDIAPSGYVLNNAVYMVNLSATGAQIYSDNGFSTLLIEPVQLENRAIDDIVI